MATFSQKNSQGVVQYLYTKSVQLKGRPSPSPIYFFRKVDEPKDDSQSAVEELPEGKEVFENKRNGLLMLRNKK